MRERETKGLRKREILRKKTDNERLRDREGETETERERLRDSH